MKLKTVSKMPLSQRGRRSKQAPISDLMSRSLASPGLISLAAGFVDSPTLPVAETKEAFDAIWKDTKSARKALQYGSTMGDEHLRDLLLGRLAQQDGQAYDDVGIERLMITSGSNQLLHLLAETLLDEDDIVICTAPTYFVFMGLLQDMGASPYGVEMDQYGMIPDSLQTALEKLAATGNIERVKAIYLVSYFDNPSGMSTSLDRRAEIVEIAKRWSTENRIYIIEDAAYRDLRFEGEDLPSLLSFDRQRDTVIHTGTFSKSFSPGIRVGWGVFPEELIGVMANLKGNMDFGSPNFSQEIVAKMIELDLFDRHIESLRINYARKKNATIAAAEKYLGSLEGVSWHTPHGGLYLWLNLPEQVPAGTEGPLFEKALEKGMLYVPGEYCFATDGVGVRRNTIRLTFGVQQPEQIDAGVKLLAEAIRELV